MNLKFPLKLSCGHFTNDACMCWKERGGKYQSNGDSPIDKALEQFNGQWRSVLENYGARLPSGKHHGPCPVCGGKDRFRFDDKNGRGTWFCSQCEPQSGGGLLLLSRYLGKPTIEAAKELVGDDMHKSIAPKRIHQVNDDEIRKANIQQAKKGAAVLIASSFLTEHEYMTNKGLTGKWLTNGEPIMSKGAIIGTGELLLVPFYKNGELVNVQKITKDGTKRPLWGGDMAGVQHIIDGKTKTLAVVEGYATGVTVNLMTGYEVYCGYNTGNLAAAVKKAKEDHPDSRIIIFADHDELDEVHNRRPGEYFANEAAAPFNAIVALPPELGDWDDYRQKHGIDNCKIAMRDAIKKDMGIKPVLAALEVAPVPELGPEPIQQPAPVFGSWLNQPQQAPAQQAPAPKKKTGLDALPEGVDFDGLDIDHPPGLAGEIVKYTRNGAHRRLTGGAYSVFAIQTMAMAGYGLTGFADSKLSLITIMLGVSAAGKERPQKVMKELLSEIDVFTYGDIRSDKDILRAAIYDQGRCFYVYDEAHKLLSNNATKNNPNSDQIVGTLMSLATTSLLTLSKLHQSEFAKDAYQLIGRYEKQLAAKQDILLGYNKDLEQGKIKAIEIEIANITAEIAGQTRLLESIKRGVKNPALNLAASSTPQKMADMINEENIEQGFLGRGLMVDCGEEREKKNTSLRDRRGKKSNDDRVLYEHLKAEIGMIAQLANQESEKTVENEFNGVNKEVDATPAAFEMLCNIDDHYEQNDYRNHQRLGPLYARLSERVINVSSILALGNFVDGTMTITTDHVRFALMMAINSIQHMASNLKVNEAKDGETIEAKLEGIKEVILKRLDVAKDDSDEGWRYLSKIKGHLRRQKYYQDIADELAQHSQDAFNNAITSLNGDRKIELIGKKVRLKR